MQDTVETTTDVHSPPSFPMSKRDIDWQRNRKFVRARLRAGELGSFVERLNDARPLEGVEDRDLMQAAVAFERAAADKSLGSWWPPCPTEDDLADPDEWLTQAVTAAKAAEADKVSTAELRRAAGRRARTGKGKPVWQQDPKLSLDEFAKRLELTVSELQSKHGEFKLNMLDPNSKRYKVSKGSIVNKQIILAACKIAGAQERTWPEPWSIVCKYMREVYGSTNPAFAQAQ